MKRFVFPLLALLLAALACNLPNAQNQSQGADAQFTAAAQTLSAQFTSAASTQGGTATTPTPTITQTLAPNQPTSTATSSPTITPTSAPATLAVPCNLASFVKDVTIPDDTKIMVGTAFTKTWRFKNVGTCTWTSSYQVVFDHGDQMGGPVTQQLSSGSVPPGATVDFSLDMTAPATAGTYAGYWKFRDSSNVLFGLSTGSFWVQIKAVKPTPTPTNTSVAFTPTPTATFTLPPPAIATTAAIPLVVGESGSVRSDGTVLGFPNVGDIESNASSQGFLSFDISSIPAGAHISAVKLNFSNYDTLGDPFAHLGGLRMYSQNYGSLDASDFVGGSPLGAVALWSNAGVLSSPASIPDPSIVTYLQSRLGSSRAQFRVEFNEHATNSDGIADMVRLGATIQLLITYVFS